MTRSSTLAVFNKVYFKFTRSLGRLQPAAHFVQGAPLTPEPLPGIVLMQIRRGNQFIPHILWPPTGVAPHDPSSPLLTLSGPATIPDPAPETKRLEFKAALSVPCPSPVRPLSVPCPSPGSWTKGVKRSVGLGLPCPPEAAPNPITVAQGGVGILHSLHPISY
ncbi:unnamed protein product [Pleuronectes platessa]|uniref:Uncharacterized protein n=1 Tax=Pleuronectes platessa TaxID=8262 RepID=A0A9N7TNY7_PLEPL|nr:unnamed protein product [Pleuronectes platessa]